MITEPLQFESLLILNGVGQLHRSDRPLTLMYVGLSSQTLFKSLPSLTRSCNNVDSIFRLDADHLCRNWSVELVATS